jgi:hypothetical protein
VCRAASIFSHSVALSADRWPDDMRLSDIEPRSTCTVCGRRGADALAVSYSQMDYSTQLGVRAFATAVQVLHRLSIASRQRIGHKRCGCPTGRATLSGRATTALGWMVRPWRSTAWSRKGRPTATRHQNNTNTLQGSAFRLTYLKIKSARQRWLAAHLVLRLEPSYSARPLPKLHGMALD